MDSIDKLLAQIKAEYQGSDQPEVLIKENSAPLVPKTDATLDSLLDGLEVQPDLIKQQQLKKSVAVDSLLSDLKEDYAAKDRAEAELKQAQLKAEKLKQQQLQVRQREVLQNRAIAWLEKLDPLSSEGL